jgi:hypothetical protein
VGIIAHPCNPGTEEAEAGGAQVLSQPGLHSKAVYKKRIKYLRIYLLKW